ncbi:hypothetical protein Hrd1104_00650 [Halorhabdus sp. CBA1104]|uniref:DUF7533 family protein n=1 Tax=unclassified Halorhabdus TaxID=2621901 RepID=UPI0012B423DA|nr:MULTISPECIES: hypothetical protein [unclassified Halorhabdus]QGN05945.1 hypothetical protein Hrd1104_00650 [Halorhabdus sp. CBA1104]
MAAGLLETIGRVGTAVVVAPIAVIAVDFLASGRVVGGLTFLGIIGLIIAVERYVVTPGDLLQRGLSGLAGTIVKTESADDE